MVGRAQKVKSDQEIDLITVYKEFSMIHFLGRKILIN